MKGLLDICFLLKLSRELKEYFSVVSKSSYPLLLQYFDSLYTNKNLEESISHKILDENTVDDKASQKLYNIRKEQKQINLDIKDKLNYYIHSATYSKYLQDNVITMRNERFVIPVKEEYRGEVKGFVHDISASGSTVFIEPLSVFELNNKLSSLLAEENIEILKILSELSSLLFPITKELSSNLEIIGKLDFIFAKANYSCQISAISPIINEKKYINLVSARHPLINPDSVVPISINLGDEFKSLIITGPNTGGKTVALKTVGLLILMAQSGLHIPSDKSSSIYIFDNIFADIGDEQSIAENLSTFSSHITNIVEILKFATSDSLVLLDELGSGTDPREGALLAISILEAFYGKNILTISTTHYPELKNYALTTNGFKNASFEFDIDNLKPTYKLLIGIPGKSNAFAICEKLGLDKNILNTAKENMSSTDVDIEDLLKSIYDNKIEIEKEKDEISKNLIQIQDLRKKLEKDYSDSEYKAEKMIIDAKNEARDILLNAKDEATNAIKTAKEITKNLKSNSITDLENLRNELNNNIRILSVESLQNANSGLNKNDIRVGMKVFVCSLSSEGIVLTTPNQSGEVQVQIGTMKITSPISNLIRSSSKDNKKAKTQKLYYSSQKSKTISSEINVIGMNVEDAISVIDKYLDDAKVSKLENVRIVHGKGTGKLRAGIHKFLKTHPHVKNFRVGTYGEGEMGVTVVTLK